MKSTNANNYNNDGAAGEDSMAAGVGAKALKNAARPLGIMWRHREKAASPWEPAMRK